MFSNDKTLQHQLFYSHNFKRNPYFYMWASTENFRTKYGYGFMVFHMDTIIAERKSGKYYNTHLDFSTLTKLKIREKY